MFAFGLILCGLGLGLSAIMTPVEQRIEPRRRPNISVISALARADLHASLERIGVNTTIKHEYNSLDSYIVFKMREAQMVQDGVQLLSQLREAGLGCAREVEVYASFSDSLQASTAGLADLACTIFTTTSTTMSWDKSTFVTSIKRLRDVIENWRNQSGTMFPKCHTFVTDSNKNLAALDGLTRAFQVECDA